MDDIVQEFLIESHENLDHLDRDLIDLESSPNSQDLLSRIFRTIHTIKGTSGFLAFHNLEKVAHVGENLLVRLRDGDMTMSTESTDVLLLMVDTIRDLLSEIEQNGNDNALDIRDVVVRIASCYEGVAAGGTEPGNDTAKPGAGDNPPAPDAAADPDAGSGTDTGSAESAATPAPAPQETADATVPAQADAPAAETTPAAASDQTPPSDATPPGDAAAPEADGAAAGAPRKAPAGTITAAEDGAKPAAGKRSAAEAVVRVDVELLDELMTLVGELVLTRNQIIQYSSQRTDQTLLHASQRLNLIASELQEGVMKTRMQPMETLWSKFPRVVRDLGGACGKNVQLNMIGKETELDRTLLEAVKDPFTHLIRNAVDHGIESPEERAAANKTKNGTITLHAYHEGGQVVVEIRDDGKGIDGKKVAAKAVEKGLKTPEQIKVMSNSDLINLIFLPGFSTAAAVTNVSGRGVGMDVVRSNIEGIGGTIEIESQPGKGSTFRLRIPLTLAIVPALTIECSGDIYAIPQLNLVELVALDLQESGSQLEEVGGVPVYRLRGKLLPLMYLADILNVERNPDLQGVTIAVLNAEGKRFGVVLDNVISTEEIVVKPLSKQLKDIGKYSGATILGSGRVALILDVPSLARHGLNPDGIETEASNMAEEIELFSAEAAVSSQILVVGIGDGRQVGIPLKMVTRLEEIAVADIETVGSREVLQHRDALLPILRLDRHLGAYSDSEIERVQLVVYSHGGRSVAIVVDSILDIVEESDAESFEITDTGLLGSVVIRDKVVELLDVQDAVLAVDPTFFDEIDTSIPEPSPFDLEGAPSIQDATEERAH